MKLIAGYVVLAWGLLWAGRADGRPQIAEFLLVPQATGVVSSSSDGSIGVGMRFSLGPLTTHESESQIEGDATVIVRNIDQAFLEFQLGEVPEDSTSEYGAYAITETWETVEGRELVLRTGRDPVGSWENTAADYALGTAGKVRLDVRELVQTWFENPGTNFGVLVVARGPTRAAVLGSLAIVKLVVRSGLTEE